MKNSTQSLLFTLATSISAIVISVCIQLCGQTAIDEKTRASYLDPITVDVLASLAAVFLIIEGICRLVVNKEAPLKSQATRSFRVGIGFAVLTIHIIQFIHK